MCSIKARFDGEKITPNEPFPIQKPCDAIVTFAEPAKEDNKPKTGILDFAGMFDQEDVDTIEEIIKERYEPCKMAGYAVS